MLYGTISVGFYVNNKVFSATTPNECHTFTLARTNQSNGDALNAPRVPVPIQC